MAANTTMKPICNALSLPITYFPSTVTPCLPRIRSRSIKLRSSSVFIVQTSGFRNNRFVFPSRAAQTSVWAHQGDDSPSPLAVQEDLTWDDSQFENSQENLSDWEVSGGDTVALDEEQTEEGEDDEGEGEEDDEEEGEFSEPPEDAKLFVGNLPYDIDSEKLAQLFEPAGIVEIAEVIYNRETDQSRGFGFVTMSTVEEAEKAVQLLNRYDINGRFLTVNKAAPRGERPERPIRTFEPSFRAYVGNLPWDVDNNRLEEIFSQYGEVVSARVVFDRETGRSRGFGFVTMASEKEINDAIAALDGQAVDGRTVRVNIAEERPRRNF